MSPKNNKNTLVPEVDERELLSPFGSRLQRSAERIDSLLLRRAKNKIHTEALKEYNAYQRTEQDAAFSTYGDNLKFTKDLDDFYDEAYDEAMKINHTIDRAQKIESAKDRVRSIGTRVVDMGAITLDNIATRAEVARERSAERATARAERKAPETEATFRADVFDVPNDVRDAAIDSWKERNAALNHIRTRARSNGFIAPR